MNLWIFQYFLLFCFQKIEKEKPLYGDRMTKQDMQNEALRRIEGNQSMANFRTVIEGFIEMGIPEEEILPKENVYTFQAWLAKGRCVRKGEHGVRLTTFIPIKAADGQDLKGETGKGRMRPKNTTVFHISQTEKVEK